MSELNGIFKVGMYCPFCRSPHLSVDSSHKPIKLVKCNSCDALYRLVLYALPDEDQE